MLNDANKFKCIRAHAACKLLIEPVRRMVRAATGNRADTCILTAATAIDVLKLMGVKARGLCVQCTIFNRAASAWIDSLPPGVEPTLAGLIEREAIDGAWSVGLGVVGNPMGPGHVVALVEDAYMLDATLDQASRPERGMVVENTIVPITNLPLFLSGSPLHGRSDDGSRLTYQVVPHGDPRRELWLRAPDWTIKGNAHRQLVRRVYDAITQPKASRL